MKKLTTAFLFTASLFGDSSYTLEPKERLRLLEVAAYMTRAEQAYFDELEGLCKKHTGQKEGCYVDNLYWSLKRYSPLPTGGWVNLNSDTLIYSDPSYTIMTH